jgi:hypothetical protein
MCQMRRDYRNSAGHSAALGRSSKSYSLSLSNAMRRHQSRTNGRRGKHTVCRRVRCDRIGSDRQCSALVALQLHYDC